VQEQQQQEALWGGWGVQFELLEEQVLQAGVLAGAQQQLLLQGVVLLLLLLLLQPQQQLQQQQDWVPRRQLLLLLRAVLWRLCGPWHCLRYGVSSTCCGVRRLRMQLLPGQHKVQEVLLLAVLGVLQVLAAAVRAGAAVKLVKAGLQAAARAVVVM